MAVRIPQTGQAFFLWSSQIWPHDIGALLRANVLSMPAGKLGALVALLPAFLDTLLQLGVRASHILCFTDSVATRAAVNFNGSTLPQLNYLARHLTMGLNRQMEAGGAQLLAIHVPGIRNIAADGLSRATGAQELLRDIRSNSPLTPVKVTFQPAAFTLLRDAAHIPYRDA